MANAIIIVIILVVIVLGIKETIKHFKGEGACCGESATKVKRKKLKKQAIHSYVLQIDGMHCQHCVNAITEIINDFDGATGRVNLKKGEAVVLCDREIDIEAIKEKIQKRGYVITSQH